MMQDGMTAVVDALVQPALLLAGAGRIVHANAAATARFGIGTEATCYGALRGLAARCSSCALDAARAARAAQTCRFERDGLDLGLRLVPLDDDLCLGTLAEAAPHARLAGEARDLLQAILDSSTDVFIATDRQHRIEYVNRAFVERFGVPETAFVGRNFRDVWRPFPGLAWDDLEERVLRRGEVVRRHDVEYPSSVGGGTVWLNVTFSPRRDAAGAIVGAVTTVNYVTEQRRLALQLEESERRYRALFESAPVGLIIIGPDRTFRLINSTAANMSVRPHELTGRRFEDFVAPEDRARILAAFTRVVQTGQRRPEGNDFTAMGPDGERRQVHIRVNDIEYQGQRCMLAALVDVTELKRLQSELARAERLAGLGALAAGVAHEFNNVLAAIQGRAEIIAGGAGPEAPLVGDCARAIVRHSRRGAEIIDQIGSLAAIRPVRPVALRWEDVVEDVLGSLAPRLVEEHVTVERDYRARGAVSADAGQVSQMVLNLLQNARDAIRPQGRGTIAVGTRDLDEGVALDLTDDGIGMDERTRLRLFDPFFTTKGDADRRGDLGTGLGLGLGLGLAVVHGVVRAHDGRIEVSSTPGAGTRLTVIFPATEEAVELGRPTPLGVSPAPRSLRVTVVDDDADVTEMITLALATRGCNAVAINDGRRAADACVEIEADVILMDRLMPPVDGLEVLREVRRRGVTTPAVLLSGRRADEDPELLRALGVRRRLEKPVGLADLFAAIDEACPGWGAAGGGGGWGTAS